LLVPLIWFLASAYGAKGAAVAWLLINSTYVLAMTPVFFRRYLREEQREWYFRDQIVPLLLVWGTLWSFSAAMPLSLSKPGIMAWLILT
jgi:hypothetical protein